MGSKLIRGPGYGRPVGMMIELPYPEAMVARTLTVILKTDGFIELQGAVGNVELGKAMLETGVKRLEQWHEELAKVKAEAEAKQKAFIGEGDPV